MQDYSLIPTPIDQRWREIRIRYLPYLAFALSAIIVGVLWRQTVSPATLTGLVEPIRASVNSPIAGAIMELNVKRFEMVKAGMTIATLRPVDAGPDLDFMRSQLEIMRSRTEPLADMRRSRLDYQTLRLSWLEQKVDLATAKINLQFAETDLGRAEKLLESNSITGKSFDGRLQQKEAYEVEVTERSKLVTDLGKELEELGPPGQGSTDASDPVEQLIRSQEEKLRSIEKNLGLVILTAPMDGMILSVLRREGENVNAGEPIIQIGATHSERIVGYLRQPFPLEPQAGMAVEIRTRTNARETSMAQITRVGAEFELIINASLHPSLLPESGLPIEVTLPPGLKVRPGEVVDLTIRP